ncbi:hypothetical protein ccbrp13_32820 [Ktedonobacteria bacterium brp13]|nr:hypothetical protein ccbrp13_32820 [Ktedonobacteria bacterium brp13]
MHRESQALDGRFTLTYVVIPVNPSRCINLFLLLGKTPAYSLHSNDIPVQVVYWNGGAWQKLRNLVTNPFPLFSIRKCLTPIM